MVIPPISPQHTLYGIPVSQWLELLDKSGCIEVALIDDPQNECRGIAGIFMAKTRIPAVARRKASQ